MQFVINFFSRAYLTYDLEHKVKVTQISREFLLTGSFKAQRTGRDSTVSVSGA